MKSEPETDARTAREHHPVFRRFPCWEGRVPEGLIVNFLGAMSRVDFFESYQSISRGYPADRYVRTQYPPFEEEYFEWVDVLEAVAAAEGHFTMLELGAGFGRWTANAAAALRRLSGLPHTFVVVEAEPTHFGWLVQNLLDNAVDSNSVRLVQAAVAGKSGKVGFHVGETQYGGPGNWYGQCIGGSQVVEAASLGTLLDPLHVVDLIDIDVQGAEFDVLEPAAEELDAKVKRVHIGTHGPKIEEGLHSLFGRLGWKCLRSYPCQGKVETEWGTITFHDGVQSWLNPSYYSSKSVSEETMLKQKLEAARAEAGRLWAELEKIQTEVERERTAYAASKGRRLLEKAGSFRDRVAPAGTQRRKLFDFVTRKI